MSVRIAARIEPKYVQIGLGRKCAAPGVEDLAGPTTEVRWNQANEFVKHWHASVAVCEI
jgi:hypothetical protein